MAEQGTAGASEGSPSFGELLRHFRTAAGLSQEELAEHAGLSAHGISDLERGARQKPYPDTVQRLADSLQLDAPQRAALVAAARRSGRAVATAASQAPGVLLPQALSSFVGRDPELTLLDSKLLEASAGRGGMVVVTGEPGIGKTCLAERFAVRAREAGGLVLWGHCFEGEISAAYAPWTEILRAHVQMTGPTRLRELLGAGAPALARLVPEIRASLPDTPGAAALEPDDERFRLHDAVAQLFLRIAQDLSVVLVLDDLHWADRDSLRLLRHVARFLRQARLLLVGTYRDVEVNQQHPLAETLAMLRREVDYARVALKGWSRDETAAYLAVEAGQELPLAFVQHIHDEADGSPFYTRQLFRHLVEEQTIVKREGRWATDRNLHELGIPEGVRQVIGRRMARLSEPTNTLLHRAAAFTGGFDFDILRPLTDLDEPTLLDCIDEGLAAGLIRAVQGRGETYDFAHAIVRHTLYDELSPSRRARLHRRIAESMELLEPRSGGRLAAEIASQYHASASVPGVERGVQYAVRAAEQARAQYAVDQAVALLRLARDMADQGTPAERADVLQRLAVAEADAVLLEDAPRTVEAALEALRAAAADPAAVIAFIETVARLLKDGGAPHAIWGPLVERGLVLVSNQRDIAWARLSLLQDRFATLSSGSIAVSRWLGFDQEAVRVAQRVGDECDYARSLDPLVWREMTETQEALIKMRSWSTPTAVLRGLNVVGRDLFYRHGEFHSAVERYRELLSVADRFGSIPDQAEACAQLAGILMTLGEFGEATQKLLQAQQLVGRLGAGHRLHFVVEVSLPAQFAYYTTGNWSVMAERARHSITDPEGQHNPLGLMAAATAAVVHLRIGMKQDAERIIEDLVPILAQLEPRLYVQNHAVSIAGAVIWELEATSLAPTLLRLARELAQAGVAPGTLSAHELTAARMAALMERWDEAGRWFARARVVEETHGQWPARALLDMDEAVALLRRGQVDRPRVESLLQEAQKRFHSLGMSYWMERAEALTAFKMDAPVLANPDGLTAREVEVLKLVAAGHTSKEIAARLVVSLATVQRHIANIYLKIGARGRADATAYAARGGLLPT